MMRRLYWILLLLSAPPLTDSRLCAQPLAGSQIPLEENNCALCHGESELWKGEQRQFYISVEELNDDIHWQKGVGCHDCHGGNPGSEQFGDTHRKEIGVLGTAEQVKEACARCHRAAMIEVARKSVHAKGGKKNELGESTPLECSACHGPVKHQLLPIQDPRSPVFLDNQVQTCGGCHEKELKTYTDSVHGRTGLVSTSTRSW